MKKINFKHQLHSKKDFFSMLDKAQMIQIIGGDIKSNSTSFQAETNDNGQFDKAVNFDTQK